jgi:hypothetical protein
MRRTIPGLRAAAMACETPISAASFGADNIILSRAERGLSTVLIDKSWQKGVGLAAAPG